MLIARAGALLACAVASTTLCGCLGTRVSADTPAGVSLAGNWKLDPAASDDPHKVLAKMRAKAQEIINSANAAAGRAPDPPPAGAAAGAAGPSPGAPHGPRRDPLAHSQTAHIVQSLLERGDHLTVVQKPDEMVFDYGTSRRSFTPGGHSVVSAEGGVGDQTSGWNGKDYVINIKPQNGPAVTETYGLSPDGKHLLETLHINQYELPFPVDVKRTYDPTTETGPRQLSPGG
jgi:hypothetical protein